jgi:hypothetical protein
VTQRKSHRANRLPAPDTQLSCQADKAHSVRLAGAETAQRTLTEASLSYPAAQSTVSGAHTASSATKSTFLRLHMHRAKPVIIVRHPMNGNKEIGLLSTHWAEPRLAAWRSPYQSGDKTDQLRDTAAQYMLRSRQDMCGSWPSYKTDQLRDTAAQYMLRSRQDMCGSWPSFGPEPLVL